jgi:hypothetical protein
VGLTFANGAKAEADIVVAADGVRSDAYEASRRPRTRFAAILELHEPAPQVKAIAAERGAENPLQVGSMQTAIGRPEAQAIGLSEANGMSGDPRAGGAVAINELGWLGRRRNDRIEHAKPLQFPRAVGRQGDRRADFRQFVRLFKDLEGYSALTQRQRERKAANACPDDCDAEPWRHCLRGSCPAIPRQAEAGKAEKQHRPG